MKRRRLRGRRLREEALHRRAFCQPARIDEQDFVAEAARLSQIVRGHHDLGPACVDLANDRFDLACGAGVEVRGGLVEEQHLGLERPRSSEREFLLLAA